ncbi:type II toxin-antitoxin system HicB family antitoxin [Nitrobacter sp. TKz-YC02]|uniref:type II toxin-antitoxin system HicB family antitoxin n=1 Tax=Nitrobacter sp. TKz-YC02 TaxID=3398704 RepID=UPI003CEC3D35
MDYPIVIVPLPEDEGGGFLGYVPDLKGCMSDGSTREETAKNTEDAIAEWLDAARQRGMDVPAPNSAAERERGRKARLANELKRLAEGVDQIEGRLQELERVAREIEERLEHHDAWDRFVDLTGDGPVAPGRREVMPC